MYVAMNVLKRLDGGVVVYRCLQRISDGSNFVQSADRLRLPIRGVEVQEHDNQFWQLLAEADPETRSEASETIEQAIQRFDDYFAGQSSRATP